MAEWKQNKVIGIIAGIVALILIGIAIARVTSRGKVSKEQVTEIQKINKQVEQEMKQMEENVGEPGVGPGM